MAFIEIPRQDELEKNVDKEIEPIYLKTESIDVLSYPRRSNEGFYYTFTIMANGAKIEPRFLTMEDCKTFHSELKSKLGI